MEQSALLEELNVYGGLRGFVDTVIMGRTPWIFTGDGAGFADWRERVGEAGKVQAGGLFVVGSAGTGYSLRPDQPGQPFRPIGSGPHASDLDVAIVDAGLFHSVWDEVVEKDRGGGLVGPVRGVFGRSRPISALMEEVRVNVYWGLVADRLSTPGSATGAQVRALSAEATRLSPTLGLRFRGRIYRRAEDMRQYHLIALRRLQRAVAGRL
jgi:hypothetical protein